MGAIYTYPWGGWAKLRTEGPWASDPEHRYKPSFVRHRSLWLCTIPRYHFVSGARQSWCWLACILLEQDHRWAGFRNSERQLWTTGLRKTGTLSTHFYLPKSQQDVSSLRKKAMSKDGFLGLPRWTIKGQLAANPHVSETETGQTSHVLGRVSMS